MAVAAGACISFLKSPLDLPHLGVQLGTSKTVSKRARGRYSVCRSAQSSSAASNQRHVIITGGNAGIGKATATELAKQGMNVTIACRSKEKGEKAAAEIVQASNNSAVRVMRLDLASLASVREFAAEYLDTGFPLHSLVNNAGVMACPLQYTLDGFEYQLGVNHLGHFLLTALLLDKLQSSASTGRQSRVVVLSSAAEKIGTWSLAISTTNLENITNGWLMDNQNWQIASSLMSFHDDVNLYEFQ